MEVRYQFCERTRNRVCIGSNEEDRFISVVVWTLAIKAVREVAINFVSVVVLRLAINSVRDVAIGFVSVVVWRLAGEAARSTTRAR